MEKNEIRCGSCGVGYGGERGWSAELHRGVVIRYVCLECTEAKHVAAQGIPRLSRAQMYRLTCGDDHCFSVGRAWDSADNVLAEVLFAIGDRGPTGWHPLYGLPIVIEAVVCDVAARW